MNTPVLPVSRMRDLSILDLGDDRVLVVACDSVGSIGPKPHDVVATTAELTAHYAVRVPLLETIAAGARPELIVDALSVEKDPTGEAMIAEVRRMAATLGLGPERVTGSTEDNVPSVATGVGVTVIATASRATLRPGRAQRGDLLLCLGRPTSAPRDEVVLDDERMVRLDELQRILALEGVREALPVGSHGIGYEIGELVGTAGLAGLDAAEHGVDLAASGGPASCVLVAVHPDARAAVEAQLAPARPRALLGVLR